jgi:protein-S-isoprenylcysteine O-methyltransferase
MMKLMKQFAGGMRKVFCPVRDKLAYCAIDIPLAWGLCIPHQFANIMNLPPPYVLGSVWGFSELALSLLKRAKAGAAARDRNSFQLIWLVTLVSTALGVTFAYTARHWLLPWRDQLYAAGCGVFLGGLILRWYAIYFLGRFFTVNVAIAADHRVIQTGPYRWVRHPSYSGMLLMVLGLCLCLGNLASLLVMVVPILGVTGWRMRIEEAALAQGLGDEYVAYMRRTKRLIPFVY